MEKTLYDYVKKITKKQLKELLDICFSKFVTNNPTAINSYDYYLNESEKIYAKTNIYTAEDNNCFCGAFIEWYRMSYGCEFSFCFDRYYVISCSNTFDPNSIPEMKTYVLAYMIKRFGKGFGEVFVEENLNNIMRSVRLYRRGGSMLRNSVENAICRHPMSKTLEKFNEFDNFDYEAFEKQAREELEDLVKAAETYTLDNEILINC